MTTHYAMTHAEHEAARGSYVDPDRYREGHRDYMPEMICRTGDGHAHKDCTRNWRDVDCIDCLKHHPSYLVRMGVEFALHIKSLGFVVYLAGSNDYGFITDDSGERVLSFSMHDCGSLSGNYGPPSAQSGTGWRLEQSPDMLRTAQDVKHALYAGAPNWAGKGWKNYTTAAQHLGTYAASSKYRRV